MPNSEERDKLLQELAYLDQAEYIDKQVCHKLVEIVEEHFRDSTTQLCKGCDQIVRYICEECGYPVKDSKPGPNTEGVEEEWKEEF